MQSQAQSTSNANFQQSGPTVRPVQNRSYHPQLAQVQNAPPTVVPNVQSAPQGGAPHVQQTGVQHLQNVNHVQPSHAGAASGQQTSGTVHHQPTNSVMVGSSNQMQTINSNQYKANNQVCSTKQTYYKTLEIINFNYNCSPSKLKKVLSLTFRRYAPMLLVYSY